MFSESELVFSLPISTFHSNPFCDKKLISRLRCYYVFSLFRLTEINVGMLMCLRQVWTPRRESPESQIILYCVNILIVDKSVHHLSSDLKSLETWKPLTDYKNYNIHFSLDAHHITPCRLKFWNMGQDSASSNPMDLFKLPWMTVVFSGCSGIGCTFSLTPPGSWSFND